MVTDKCVIYFDILIQLWSLQRRRNTTQKDELDELQIFDFMAQNTTTGESNKQKV